MRTRPSCNARVLSYSQAAKVNGRGDIVCSSSKELEVSVLCNKSEVKLVLIELPEDVCESVGVKSVR